MEDERCMILPELYKSVIEQDRASVVICTLDDTIVYMNPAACVRYKKHGGALLVGQSIKTCHNPHSGEIIDRVTAWFAEDSSHNMIHTFFNEKENKDVYMVALRDDSGKLTGYYEKHEYRNRETAAIYDFDNPIPILPE